MANSNGESLDQIRRREEMNRIRDLARECREYPHDESKDRSAAAVSAGASLEIIEGNAADDDCDYSHEREHGKQAEVS